VGSFNHFKNLNYISEYAKARGTPSPKLAVGGTGVILLLGGLSMLLGVYPVVGIILLIIFRERYLNHILSASADWGKLGA
jgi:putative oxidoreductase